MQPGVVQRTVRFEFQVFALVVLVYGTLPPAAARDAQTQIYGRLPLSFEANQGQVDSAVRFLSRGEGYTLFLTSTEAVLSLRGAQRDSIVRMRLVGGNRDPRLVGVSPRATKSNYLLGNDPRHWHTDVPHYDRVRAEDVYPGVDLIYRGNPRQLEYDFVIAPGADPGRIRLAFRGADAITRGAEGELILHTANGDLVQHAPVVYQEIGEQRQRVDGRYILLARREVGFEIGRYDRTRPLIIDPVLSYSTYLGGSSSEHGFGTTTSGIAVDGAGNAYIASTTDSTTFPGVSGSSIQPARAGDDDAFVTKINAAGTAIVYSTFLGGSGGDLGTDIAVDGAGNAYVTGMTNSFPFPGINGSSIQPGYAGGFSDGFVTKIDPAGAAIVYSTFLGGSDIDESLGIAADAAGNVYITGWTSSTTFPGVNGSSIQPIHAGGFRDGFVTKIDPAGTAIVYSTFLGGSGVDEAKGIAIDSAGGAYVTGRTFSTTFPGVSGSSIQPAKGGSSDAFVTKIDPTGTAIVYSTFLVGSPQVDEAFGIAVDFAGNACVTGFTFVGPDSEAFVIKVNPAGTALVYSILLGGSGSESGLGVGVDGAGNAYVTGWTNSTSFTGVDGSSIQPVYGGGLEDAFVTRINLLGTAIDSTFLGGSGEEFGRGIAVDVAGNANVTGTTDSTNFPGTNESSIQPVYGGGVNDAFVTKISSADLLNVEIPTLSQWGLISMAMLLAAMGFLGMRRTWQPPI
ncbi:MAG TPA: IPTL-CTERM sorting domain-containing protein [Thermoanaerobaculia bacterium]|nr:IPTL-CTERM sorting domain-containing protein [Thermoanaerobaculia bacterium]